MVKFQFAIAGAASTLVASAATAQAIDGDSANLFFSSFATTFGSKADELSNGRTLRGLQGNCDIVAVTNCVKNVSAHWYSEYLEGTLAPTCGTVETIVNEIANCGHFNDECKVVSGDFQLNLQTCEEMIASTNNYCNVTSICGSWGNMADSLDRDSGALVDGDDNNANGTVADNDDDDYEGDYDDNNVNGTVIDSDDDEGDDDDYNLNGTMTRNLADDLVDDDDDYEDDDYGYDSNSTVTMTGPPVIDDDLDDDYNGDGNSTLPEDVDEDESDYEYID